MTKHAILGFLGALALFGCGGGGNGGGSSSDSKPRVAYVNASSDAGGLDFLLNRATEASALPYGTATDFATVSAKDYDVSIRPNGSSETIWSEAHTFDAGANAVDNVVIALGLRTPPSDTTQTPPVVENDKRLVLSFATVDRNLPVGNRARLLIVHALVRKAGFGTPAIDFRNPGNTPAVEVTGIGFGGTIVKDVDSGSQTFEARQSGTEQDFVNSKTFTLTAGGVYVALVSGVEGGTGSAAPDIRLIPIPTRAP